VLIEQAQPGMASPSVQVGPLSDAEARLHSLAARLRALIPKARQRRSPPAGWSGSRA
jgi:hypothetical protein